MINAHQSAAITSRCREMAGLASTETTNHQDCSPSRIAKDKISVESLMKTFTAVSTVFPENGSALFNIVSGVVTDEDVQRDLTEAHRLGDTKFVEFVTSRLSSSDMLFHDPINKLKLKMISSLLKTKAIKITGREVIVRADRDLFARLLIVAQNRALDIRRSSIRTRSMPWSLASVDGSLVKQTRQN